MTDKVSEIYKKRITKFTDELKKVKKSDILVASFRLLFAIVALALIAFVFFTRQLQYLIYSGLFIVLFILLVIKHQQIKNKITYLNNILDINQRALLRLAGKWTEFAHTGKQFIDYDHPYSGDLNIFGQGSLFQYLSATTTYMGNEALGKLLSGHEKSRNIGLYQQAVEELGGRLAWRQHFQAIGLNNKYRNQNPAKLLGWAEEKPVLTDNKKIYLIGILPVITLLFLMLAIFRITPLFLPGIPLILQLLIVIYSERLVNKTFLVTGKNTEQLECYSDMLKAIEEENLQSPLLKELKLKLLANKLNASQEIKNLAKIVDRTTLRYSPLIHIIINITTFWDLFTLIKLEKWKKSAGRSMGNWFEVIGLLEAFSSLAIISHDHPDWVFPEIIEGKPAIKANSLGHPLISEELRICNDFSISTGVVDIITGSNMSGKSTFLRTIGINLVLAYAGTPVCAKGMRCSIMDIYTSMQIHDDLEQRISTFYAELKRIKMIVDASKLGKPFIFLLDEIFKGTNSKDRIFAAKSVIKELSKTFCIGLVTTHDFELSVLEKENPKSIRNHHFTDRIIDNEIFFDYKLKKGVSETTNALALMKMVGIEVKE